MPKDIKTNVVVGVETKGIKEAQQQTGAFNKEIVNAVKEQTKGFAEALKNVHALGRATERAHATTRREQDKTAQATKRAAQQAEREADKVVRQAERQAQKDDQKRRGAFRQGLMQGGLPMPAPFLQRGPGMGRQIAGMAIGSAVGGTMRGGLGVGRGLAGAAFSGIGGIQQALSAIPLIGGAAAGMLGTAAGYAQQHIQFQRQRIGMAPYLASPVDRQRAAQKNRALQNWETENSRLQDLEDKLRYSRYNREQDIGGNFRLSPLTAEEMKEANKKYPQMWTTADIKEASRAGKEDVKLQKQIQAQKSLVAKSRPKGGPGVNLGLGGISGLGLNLLGAGKVEAEQAAAGIVQAGGGRMGEARAQDVIRTGFAAKTMYGIQGGISGAFLSGARRGGLAGAQPGVKGEAGRELTEALQDGLRMGLEGSELSAYLQSIAQGIQQFEMTGIPVAKDSIASMGQAFGEGGVITGTRAARLGQGLTSYTQTMGQRGIKGGMDLLMLQTMGGYKGGGAEGLQDAFIRMEKMKGGIQGKGVGEIDMQGATSDLLRQVIQLGGGGAGGEMLLQKQLARMGVTMSHAEVKLLGKRLSGEKLTPTEKLQADTELQRRKDLGKEADFIGRRDPETGQIIGLERAAKTEVSRLGGAAKTQAGIENRQLRVGGQMIGAVQTLQRSALNTNEAFTNLVKGPLKNFSTWLEDVTGQVNSILGKYQKGKTSAAGVAVEIFDLTTN